MANGNNGSSFNFDDLLDKSIDDLADLPEFKVPDTGIYGLSVKLETKEINSKPAIVCRYTVRNVVQLADESIPVEQYAKAGDGFDEAFILKDNDGKDSEIAWGRLKQFLQPFEVHFGEKRISALVKQLAEPVDITAKVTKKQRKDDKEKFSANVSDIVVD